MKIRKITALMLSTVMVIGTLAGCGGSGKKESGGEKSKGGGEYQTTYGDKKFDDVTITVELFDRSNAPKGSTLTDNRWVEYVNEQMNKVGINVEFVGVPRADEVTKMQTMMSSQTAPDLTLTYTYSHAENYFNQGGTWDLSEFIDGEDQAKNLKSYIGEDVLDLARTSEGSLYGIVAKRATTAETNLFIRKDWLDALNLEVPTTPDELFEVATQFVKNNLEGRKDAIGLYFFGLNDATSRVCFRNSMSLAFSQLGGDKKELDIASGYDYYYDPGYREYLRFVNKCYNAGLMDGEYYSMTTDTYNSDIVSGATGFFESNVNYSVDILRGNLLKTLQENNPNADIVSIPTLKNVNDGQQYTANYSPGGLVAFCPKTADAETVEACMTYLDWMCTKEGGYVLYHGFEGEHYELDENNVPVVKDAAYNATDKDWLRTDIFLTGNQGYFTTVEDFNACTAKENIGYEQYVTDNYENAMVGTCIQESVYTSPSAPDINTDLYLVCTEWVVKCVTEAESDFDKNYDAFMKAAEDAGIKTIIEERTEYYNELYGE